MSIRQLPEDVVSKIRSSASITSLNAVICGLFKNSLDAGATKVNIYVDYSRGNCTVEDNGLGIGPSELAEDGGFGKPYYTSKFPSSSGVHGRQGNFLASLAVLSLLTVTSHQHQLTSHKSISILHGKALKRDGKDRFETFDHGTRVAVHDLFGSLPVRVKHRATLFADQGSIDKEWRRLIHDVVGLLLSWPVAVAVSLRETRGSREVRLKPPEKTEITQRTLRLFTQACLADSCDAQSWVPVSASSGHITVKGCISLDPVATRQSQFMSIGISPVSNSHGSNILFEEVNKVFRNSSFGTVEREDGEAPNNYAKMQGRSNMRKGVDRWPMFYFRFMLKGADCVLDGHDISSQSRRDLEHMITLLKTMSYGFLKKYHMRPQAVQISDDSVFSAAPTRSSSRQTKRHYHHVQRGSARNSSQISPNDATSSRPDSPFDDWSRMKIGMRTAGPAKIVQSEKLAAEQYPVETRRLIGEGGKILGKPFADAIQPSTSTHEQTPKAGLDQGTVSTLVERPKRTAESPLNKSTKKARMADHELCDTQSSEAPSKWLHDVLRSWKNPVFEPTQRSLKRINDEAPPSIQEAGSTCHHQFQAIEDADVNFEAMSMGLLGRLSKSALLEAETISQVDRKFILLKLPLRSLKGDNELNSSSALVVLDQHAADERCRLEDLMAGYFEVDNRQDSLRPIVENLERPFIFEVSRRESDLLHQYQTHFAAWGIIYTSQRVIDSRLAGNEPDGCQVIVTALPPSILERCRSEPRLLVELLRKEIWHLHDGGFVPSRRPNVGDSSRAPYMNFHGCPRGILELLHSRACRSAIMFNDPLSLAECEELVRRLTRCALPFQCAHGRPSMVPLVDLGLSSRIGGWNTGENDMGRTEIWKRWMGKERNQLEPTRE